ncbi:MULTISPECIES: glucose-1-phosphate thymidylyltransferase [Halorussus]|uniref:glucose-1-phosphate thymidylyltransferase n=1 Tax=Halorussus TaxID=1070314 RepID=UPI000E213F09|nr:MULTISPECIES: glucose-1-phosphate thymidylyltransferase [Halorussus]NHN60113.1 glucose-1-phosphate thymidylyltransferase [Halorussus sp. JP-T4]
MKGLVLAGGTGSRLRPITHTGPKQLVPVANKPVIQYSIEDLAAVGVDEIGVVLGKKGREEIQNFLGDGSDFGVDITYIVQGEPLGLAHAVGCAQDFVDGDDFVVYLGDNILKQGIGEMVDRFRTKDCAAGIALQHVDNPQQFGVADVEPDGTVVRLIEKPTDPPSDLALIGIYIFSPAVFDVISDLEPSWRGELEITDAIQALIERGGTIDSHIVDGWWKDTGKPADILEANRLVLEEKPGTMKGTINVEADVMGHIDLHETATIEPGAVVRGPVSIARETVIKNGSYVGPYTSIGAESIIDGVHLENSIVVGESTLSADGRIVDSLIGRAASVESSKDLLPKGRRLVVGENSNLKL